jgi:hypothetical protein
MTVSLARWIGKAALVGALMTVAHGEANALARKTSYRPMESFRMSERGLVINWRQNNLRAGLNRAAFMYSGGWVDLTCILVFPKPLRCR